MALPRRSTSSISSMDEDVPLPFPTALPRSSFLTPEFHAATYLSTLVGRHQTLEDLRSDLRERSALISTEMHALVNTNWAEFLSLGVGLRGGEERIESVRVAVLGFKRALEEAQTNARSRKDETARLCRELDGTTRAKETARSMLDLHEGVVQLEARLGLSANASDSACYYTDTDEEEEEDVVVVEVEEEEGGEGHGHRRLDGPSRWIAVCPAKLKAMAIELARMEAMADSIGIDVPFVNGVSERMAKCRQSLLLDVWAGLKEARQAGEKGRLRSMDYLGIYVILRAEAEAVDKLRGS